MLSFLFWNLNGKPLQARVARLAAAYEVDILILAECQIAPQTLLDALNAGSSSQFYSTFSECERIAIYTRVEQDFASPIFETQRYTIRRLRLPEAPEILLVAAHLPSQLHWPRESLNLECVELSRSVSAAEGRIGHARTVLVGDLNLNPFDTGVVGAPGLHAVMTRSVAMRRSRTIQGRDYPFFYSPMWGRFGDGPNRPGGTYYHEHADHVCLFWHMFDQVLIRPALLEHFSNDDLRILTDDGAESLLSSRGKPDNISGSDHLPLLFGLNL